MLALTLLFLAAEPEPSLDRLARAVVEQAQRATPEAPVAVFVEAQPPALARAFASLVSAELATRRFSPVVIEAASAAAAERLAREKDLRTLVRVSLAVENTRLVARGDVLHTWVNFWSGATPTRSGAAAALSATVDADARALALASSAPSMPPSSAPIKLAVTVLAKLSAPPAAIAAADLDGDKQVEIVVLTDDELLVLAADGRQLARYDLRALPPATRPSREPVGALFLQPGRVSWISGRRAHGEALGYSAGTLKPGLPTDEVVLDGVTVRLVPGLNALAAEVGWFGKTLTLPAPLTTTSTRAGLTLFLFANGTGALTRGLPPSTGFAQAPSGAVLADLDGDGTPELLASSPHFFPDGDELKVLSAASAEAIAARSGLLSEGPFLWSGTTPRGRVITTAAADLDGDGAEEVLLGAWLPDGTGELQLVKRIP